MGVYADTACKGKKKFNSMRLAEAVTLRNTDKGKRTVYRCKTCGHWHVGSESTLEKAILRNYKRVKRALRDGLDEFGYQSRQSLLG